MLEVSEFLAKKLLSKLLDRVAAGDRVAITRSGKAIAMLVPVEQRATQDTSSIIRQMLDNRDKHGPKLGRGMTLRRLIEEGRRF